MTWEPMHPDHPLNRLRTIRVVLWSIEPGAVAATRATLNALQPKSGAVIVNAHPIGDGGADVLCDVADEGYLRFAMERQGYVKSVQPKAAPDSEEEKESR